ncbi:LacI family DNA-binding transcriptional regulator [Bifidobacterium eulemuris]|uniref:Transcriptional regulator n=1 Tax=Bifidobacterium eulemuris TaxID=1765219 RepID=A0A261G3A1_9BIFI|nr:LacI family DNA-binding transcriptional regulator [Bifidobacterium eulemuris]OZG65889.1 transcriptional regulator [Bifidobacterium eulemuris]QOL31960.1 LacI family DNA-binding transcriptional regulator [Bifidobacterium eulemuris]
MPATLADIAQKAGVSQATVSRVMNGKPGVSNETREAILKLAELLGVPTNTARHDSTQLIALITPDLSNPIFPQFVNTLSTLLTQQRALPILCTYAFSGTSEASLINMLQTQPIQGAILLAGNFDTNSSDHSIYQSLVDRGIPLVFLNESAHDINGFYVETDHTSAMTMALKHLINLGHTNIGVLLGDHNHYPTIAMYQASERFFLQHEIPHSEDLTAWTTYGVESGKEKARQLIDQGATAIACASDQLALGAIQAAKDMGLQVPKDISVTGFDDSLLAAQTSPALTTVRQPVSAICQSMVRSLFAMMQDKMLSARHETISHQPELIVRDSTAICKK